MTWVARLLSGFSNSLKEGMSANIHTIRTISAMNSTGNVMRIQNHLVIFFLVS